MPIYILLFYNSLIFHLFSDLLFFVHLDQCFSYCEVMMKHFVCVVLRLGITSVSTFLNCFEVSLKKTNVT